jgi:hypothetical protein
MEDDFNTLASLCANLRVNQIPFQELHGFNPDQVFALAGNKAVDTAYCFAARQKRSSNRAADEAGGSSH